MKKIAAFSLAAVALALLLGTTAYAQILLVTGEYRVTNVDRAEQRIGVALRADDPDVRQNWVYVKADTKVIKRIWLNNGTFKDKELTWNEFFEVVQKGTLLKVNGGRDWDGTIVAKKIWM